MIGDSVSAIVNKFSYTRADRFLVPVTTHTPPGSIGACLFGWLAVRILGARVGHSLVIGPLIYLRYSPIYAHIRRSDVDGVPFSPPAHDDSFFYIRYPSGSAGAATSAANEKMSISDQIRASAGATGSPALPIGQITAVVKDLALDQPRGVAGKVDLSKHTEPCRQYLAGANSE